MLGALAAGGTAFAAPDSVDLRSDDRDFFKSDAPTRSAERTKLYDLVLTNKKPLWSLTLGGNLTGTYETNALHTPSNRVGLFTSNPDMSVKIDRADDASDFSVTLDGTTARADSHRTSYNDVEFWGVAKWSWTRMGQNAVGIVPSLSYRYDTFYSGDFDIHQLSYQQYQLDLERDFVFGADKLQLGADAAYRIAAPERSGRTALEGSIGYLFSLGGGLSLVASTQVSQYWYRAGTNGGRSDTAVRAKLELDDALCNDLVAGFGISFSQGYSNFGAGRVDGWTIGPVLKWKHLQATASE